MQKKYFGLVACISISSASFISCQVRSAFQANEGVSLSDTQAQSGKSAKIGPLPFTGAVKTSVSSFSQSNEMALDYETAVREFKSAYGENADPYMVVSLRSNRFISRDAWDANKEAAKYNPILMTDKYVLEKENNPTCRAPDLSGRPTNVWAAFDRAADYAQQLVNAGSKGSSLPWSQNYGRLTHVRNYFSSSGSSYKGSSSQFDLDILLALHAANGEGATQNNSSCGKIAQVKVCDAMPYSVFFHPDPRPQPCTAAGNWAPSAAEWQAMVSNEMRELGQTAIPLPSRNAISNHLPAEYSSKFPGKTCSDAAVKKYEADFPYNAQTVSSDYKTLKDKWPEFTTKALNSGASYLGQQTQSGNLAAFAVYASVEQSYKDLFNYRLKAGILKKDGECSACGIVRDSSGRVYWDVFKREQNGKSYCPKSCLQRELPNRSSAEAKNNDVLRSWFEPDTSESGHKNVMGTLQQHFSAVKSGSRLPADPVVTATYVQQKMVAMHPFIDGDGRTSRYLMEMVLHSSGLPFPVLNNFWADTQTSASQYESLIRKGIQRHIGVLKACAAYVKCEKAANSGFSFATQCQGSVDGKGAVNAASSSCASQLNVNYKGVQDRISACDCNNIWNDDSNAIKYASCK